MRRITLVVLVLAMVSLIATPAIAGHELGGTQQADWSDWDDGWDDDWDDPCYEDPGLCYDDSDDGWDDDWDDSWDDTWDDDWDDPCYEDPGLCYDDSDDGWDDTWDDPWYDPIDVEAADAAADTLMAAFDACFGADRASLDDCLLEALDTFLGALFPYDAELDDPWEGGDWDDPWTGGDWDDPWSGGGGQTVDDPATLARVTALLEALIPAEWRTRIVVIELETDGVGGVVAAVEPLDFDLDEWALYVDPADADHELEATLIHEFAHILTLNETQLDPVTVFDDYDAAMNACPTYFSGEGCALETSFLAAFVDEFWDPIMAEFLAIEQIQDYSEWEEAFFLFYETHADQFVTDYAATSPAEDISESFTAYVLSDTLPDGDTIAEQKILFFAGYAELVDLREAIRAVL